MPEPPIISVEKLGYAYPRAGAPAIRGLSFGIHSGEVFGFLGPSGAGKSTTQKILIGLLKNYNGVVTALGTDLKKWGPDLYERIGVSFESPNHYLKLTGRENLAYFSALYRRETFSPEALLRLVGLEQEGDVPVGQYSKGMKNRLNVARSLLHNPDVLFWDEPTAGLDPMNARRIKGLARAQKAAGKTLFISTHDMTVAEELCDRIAFIVDGEIKRIDAPRALKLQFGEPRVRVEYLEGEKMKQAEFPLEGLGDNRAFRKLLQEKPIQTIHTMEAGLEEIFIKVTGRSLT